MASSADTTPTTSTNTIPMIAKHPTAFIRWILPSRDTNDDGVRYNVTPYKKEFMPWTRLMGASIPIYTPKPISSYLHQWTLQVQMTSVVDSGYEKRCRADMDEQGFR
jgi:hypothetical protein